MHRRAAQPALEFGEVKRFTLEYRSSCY